MSGVAAPAAHSKGYRYFVLILLIAIYILNFLDRQLLSILAEPIKAELGLSDTELGLLTGFMFALFYTTFGIPIAWLADRTRRTTIVGIACILWSIFSGLCGMVHSFAHLALARIGVGIGEAGGVAPSYAIVTDYFEPHRRGFALGLFSLGLPLGTALGGVYGGWIAPLFGWRIAFAIPAALGIVLGLVMLTFVREPARGSRSPKDASAESLPILEIWHIFRRSPVLLWTVAGCSLSGTAGYGMLTWAPSLLMRVHDMPLDRVGAVYSPLMGLAVGIGILGSGWLGDRFAVRSAAAYNLTAAVAFLLAAPLFALAVSAATWQATVALLLLPLLLGFTYLSPAIAVVHNNVPASARSTASAFLLFVLNLLAIGLGPVFVGVVSDLLAPNFGGDALRVAMFALIPFFLLGSFCNFMAARSLRSRDGRAAVEQAA